MRLLRVLLTTTTAAAVAVVLTLAAAGPAHAATYTHDVALGDSYASGLGTRSYISGSGDCKRSTYAYSELVATQRSLDLTFVACAGATTSTVTSDQLSAVTSSADLVTIQVGGNDAGFSSVVTTCAEPSWASDCAGAVTKARSTISNTLPGRLSTLYASIRDRAPHAKVVVVGYPRLFNGEDCNAGTFFSPDDESRLNATADLLDSVIGQRASAAGFGFVDPRTAFTGHAICSDSEWLNGLSNPVDESYHPNRSGQQAYANLLDSTLGGSTAAHTAKKKARA